MSAAARSVPWQLGHHTCSVWQRTTQAALSRRARQTGGHQVTEVAAQTELLLMAFNAIATAATTTTGQTTRRHDDGYPRPHQLESCPGAAAAAAAGNRRITPLAARADRRCWLSQGHPFDSSAAAARNAPRLYEPLPTCVQPRHHQLSTDRHDQGGQRPRTLVMPPPPTDTLLPSTAAVRQPRPKWPRPRRGRFREYVCECWAVGLWMRTQPQVNVGQPGCKAAVTVSGAGSLGPCERQGFQPHQHWLN